MPQNPTAFEPGEYVDLMAQLLELPITPEYRPGVIGNFARTTAIAQLVLEFPLPEEIEAAPVFEP
ncbi:DUF4089 domain-containing protein [Leptolyngbya sp. FACHB-261]|uniref:DUF4089 domain-containing protein n=1 Tax=Leptolyngbya sp. FACHB-261 TaxID=2692806 RepID=UPI001681E24A|nr:DUF4089 domain-containing protein [Leptolyngbya sp. FACHB-261]MBD2101405.1 DUF4089 domain-containing protein [Leptolyngbya sp. FACHB-261]